MVVLAGVLIGCAMALWVWSPAMDRCGMPESSTRDATFNVRAVAALGVSLLVWLFSGGLVGVIIAIVCGLMVWFLWPLLQDRGVREQQDLLESQAPQAAELLAACLSSGSALLPATKAVAMAARQPLQGMLDHVVIHMELGAPPEQAWQGLLAYRSTGVIARAILRSHESGAPLAHVLDSAAEELRETRQGHLERAAQSIAVRTVAPLGLCFLPAFLLLGVVPVVGSLLAQTVDQFG